MGSETIKGVSGKLNELANTNVSRDTYPSSVPMRTRCMELALDAANHIDIQNGAELVSLAKDIEAYLKGEK